MVVGIRAVESVRGTDGAAGASVARLDEARPTPFANTRGSTALPLNGINAPAKLERERRNGGIAALSRREPRRFPPLAFVSERQTPLEQIGKPMRELLLAMKDGSVVLHCCGGRFSADSLTSSPKFRASSVEGLKRRGLAEVTVLSKGLLVEPTPQGELMQRALERLNAGRRT